MLGLGLTTQIPFVVYIVGWILAVVALFANLQIPFMFLALCIPFTNMLARLDVFWAGKDFVDIILIAVLLGWIMQSARKGEKIMAKTPFNGILFFHMAFTYFQLWHGSSFLGLPPPAALSDPRFQVWKNYIILPILFFVTVNVFKDKKWMRWLVILLILATLVMGLYFFKDYRWISKDTFRDNKRGVGTFKYLGPNEWGAFHTHFLFIALGIFFVDTSLKIWAVPVGLMIFSSIYSVLFSYSRGAYLAVPFGLAIFGLLRRKFIIIVIMVLLFLSWRALVPPAVIERIEGTHDEQGQLDPASQKRLDLWDQAMAMFYKNPVSGVGFNTMPYVGLHLGFADTHNLYIKILAEQGVIGFIIFFVILVMAFKQGWKLYNNSEDNFFKGLGLGFSLCVLSMVITNFFGDRWTYLQVNGYFWIFLGIVVRANMMVEEKAL